MKPYLSETIMKKFTLFERMLLAGFLLQTTNAQKTRNTLAIYTDNAVAASVLTHFALTAGCPKVYLATPAAEGCVEFYKELEQHPEVSLVDCTAAELLSEQPDAFALWLDDFNPDTTPLALDGGETLQESRTHPKSAVAPPLCNVLNKFRGEHLMLRVPTRLKGVVSPGYAIDALIKLLPSQPLTLHDWLRFTLQVDLGHTAGVIHAKLSIMLAHHLLFRPSTRRFVCNPSMAMALRTDNRVEESLGVLGSGGSSMVVRQSFIERMFARGPLIRSGSKILHTPTSWMATLLKESLEFDEFYKAQLEPMGDLGDTELTVKLMDELACILPQETALPPDLLPSKIFR